MSKTSNRESPLEEPHGTRHGGKTSIPIAPLPDQIAQNIETIVAIHTSAERDVPKHQRVVEAATTFLGRTVFLYSSLLVVAIWLLLNVFPQSWGLPQLDPPPFDLLQLALGIISLPMTIAVLIKQERQEKLAEQRAQLSLQLNLLSEQKIAKLIALLEELRCDLPSVTTRFDPEAENMKEAADPHTVMAALEETLTQELADLQKQETSS
ncbi:MAG TPA: DUF1003 domain-containing protein [Cyanobacteria bacterium UBA11049]|nr:DUF1003 domain-containing protein [Cyanobacteria bacterium UBA11049]